MEIKKSVLSYALFVGMIQAFGLEAVSAQTVDWDPSSSGTGVTYGSGTWDLNTTADWSNGTNDGTYQTSAGGTASAANVIFGGTSTGTATVAISGQLAANTLTINSAGYTLDNGGITLTAPAAALATTNVTVNANATINATGSLTNFDTIDVASTDTLTLSSTLTAAGSNAGFLSVDTSVGGGGGALVGGGTVDLTAGTFSVTSTPSGNISNGSSTTGGLIVDGTSELYLAANGFEIGRVASGLVTVSGGSIVQTAGQLTVGRSESSTQSAALVLNSGSISNAEPSTGQSVAVFVGRDGATGSLTVNGGTMTVQDIVDLNSANSGTDSGTLNINGGVTSLGSLVFNGSDTNVATLSNPGAAIAGTTGGTGGTLNVTGGTLYIGTTDTLGISGPGIVNLNTTGAGATATINLSGGTLGANTAWSSSINMKLNTGTAGVGAGVAPITIQAANSSNVAENITLSGVISGAGGLTKTGTGTLALTNSANTYSGKTLVSAGTLSLNSAGTSSIEVASGASLTLNLNTAMASGATLTLDSATASQVQLTFALSGSTDTIDALFINGTQVTAGTYTASQLDSQFGTTDFSDVSGQNLIDITTGAAVVPEPSTWALLLGGLVLVGVARRYRRVAI